MPLTTTSPGTIGLVFFPFVGQKTFKQRPVLILKATPPGTPGDEAVLIAMITGSSNRLANVRPGDVLVPNWQTIGLNFPSVVRCRRIWTAERSDFSSKIIGQLDANTLAAVRSEVQILFP